MARVRQSPSGAIADALKRWYAAVHAEGRMPGECRIGEAVGGLSRRHNPPPERDVRILCYPRPDIELLSRVIDEQSAAVAMTGPRSAETADYAFG